MKPKNPETMSRAELIARLKALESARLASNADHAKELSTQQEIAQTAVQDREERLRAIIEAYNYLKKMGFC